MLEIDLLQTDTDTKAVHKGYTYLSTSQCVVKEPCSMNAPVFILTMGSSPINANYIYCEEFGRYYYIQEKIVITGQRIELHCKSDVLMSFASVIENMITTVTRYEGAGVNRIPDNRLPLTPSRTAHTYFLSNSPFNLSSASALSFNFVLNVSGGAGQSPNSGGGNSDT